MSFLIELNITIVEKSHDMGVVFYVWVNNYICMYYLHNMSKRKRLTKNCMPKQGLIVPFTNMFSYQYFLFRFIHCKTLFSCVQYVYKLAAKQNSERIPHTKGSATVKRV